MKEIILEDFVGVRDNGLYFVTTMSRQIFLSVCAESETFRKNILKSYKTALEIAELYGEDLEESMEIIKIIESMG